MRALGAEGWDLSALPPRRVAILARWALQEYGRLVKTLFILRYLQQPELRKRVGRQLNKGESLHALRETVHFAHHGNVRHRQLADQTPQALCLTLVINCVAAFNASLHTPTVEQLRTAGFEIDNDDVSHPGPTMTEHINVHGRYHFNLDQAPKGLRNMPALPLAVTTDARSSFRFRWFLVR